MGEVIELVVSLEGAECADYAPVVGGHPVSLLILFLRSL